MHSRREARGPEPASLPSVHSSRPRKLVVATQPAPVSASTAVTPHDDGGVLVADVGGTHIRAGYVEGSRLVHRQRVDTPRDDAAPTAVLDLMRRVAEHHPVSRAVIGLPGRINYRDMALEFAPNLPPSWARELTADNFRAALGVDVMLANDADLAAVGEAYFGAGRRYDDVVYLTVSTGIGAGVLVGRRLVAGVRSIAEIGHVVIDRVAASDGRPATVEQLGSGTAIARDAEAAGVLAHGTALLRLVETRDPRLGRAWRDLQDAVGYGAAGLAQLFAPQVIVIGGGLGVASERILGVVRQYLDTAGPRGLPESITVVASELGDDAALHGASAWHTAGPVHRLLGGRRAAVRQ